MNESIVKNTVKYAFLQGSFWMAFNSIQGFISVFLLYKGCSNSSIGFIIAIGGIISSLIQPFMGDFADRSKKVSLQMLIIFLSAINVICAAIIATGINNKFAIMLLYVLLIALMQTKLPLVNAAGMYYINRGVNINFGVARGTGSIAYAVISILIGKLADMYGAQIIPYSIIAISFLEILSALLLRYKIYREQGIERDNLVEDNNQKTSFIKKYPAFMIILLGAACVYFSHGVVNNFAFQIVANLGAGSSEMGILTAIAATVELPIMIIYGSVAKKIPCSTLLKISGVFFTIKSLGTFLAPSMTILYIVQFAQMLGFALYTLASVYYANEIVDKCDEVKGQTYVAVANVIGTTLGSIFGGILIDIGGTPLMMLVATIISGIGTVIFLICIKNTEGKKNGH